MVVLCSLTKSPDSPTVSEADTKLESPFTQPLTASMMVLKEQQSKEKAHPPGTSKILARARRKAMEDEDKKVRVILLWRVFMLGALSVKPVVAGRQDKTKSLTFLIFLD